MQNLNVASLLTKTAVSPELLANTVRGYTRSIGGAPFPAGGYNRLESLKNKLVQSTKDLEFKSLGVSPGKGHPLLDIPRSTKQMFGQQAMNRNTMAGHLKGLLAYSDRKQSGGTNPLAEAAAGIFNAGGALSPKVGASADAKTAAPLDLKRLPEGTMYPSPYDLRWKSPGGHDLRHNVKPEIVDHGQQIGGDAYYKQLVEAMNAASQHADTKAPKDIAQDLQLQRIGGGATGAMLGGMGGLLLGGLGYNSPGIGAAIGGTAGGLLGYHLTKGTPKTHMEYSVGENLGDAIPELYAHTPEDDELDDIRQMREELEEMNARDRSRDFHDRDIFGRRYGSRYDF